MVSEEKWSNFRKRYINTSTENSQPLDNSGCHIDHDNSRFAYPVRKSISVFGLNREATKNKIVYQHNDGDDVYSDEYKTFKKVVTNKKHTAPRNSTKSSSVTCLDSFPSTITTTTTTNPNLSAILSCRISQSSYNKQQPLNTINQKKDRRVSLSPSSSKSLAKSIYEMRTKQQQQKQHIQKSQHFSLCRDGKENTKVIDWVVTDEEYMNYIMDKRRNSIIR